MQAEPSCDAGSRQSSGERNRRVPLKKGRPQDLFHPPEQLECCAGQSLSESAAHTHRHRSGRQRRLQRALRQEPLQFQTQWSVLSFLVFGGKADPRQAPDNKLYVRSFFNLFTATWSVNKDDGNYLEYRDFPGGYALYAFDLSPSLLDGNQVELVKSGSLRLELKFKAALPEPVHVIAYAELDSLLEIDRSRQILTDFTS